MHQNIEPDIVTTAKGLGNGFPISVCLMRNKATNLFKPGNHGSTFGGNPLACATALAVLRVMEQDKICEHVNHISAILKEKLSKMLSSYSGVTQIRGKGLMLGVVLDRPANDIKMIGLKNKILLNVTANNVIRILPALTITEKEVNELVERLNRCIHEFLSR